jgi:hypothetical protein
VVGTGDCERGEEADELLGGPFAQADLDGSGVGIFGADAVEGLLILRQKVNNHRDFRGTKIGNMKKS